MLNKLGDVDMNNKTRPVSDLRNNLKEIEVYLKLKEAEKTARLDSKTYSSKEVLENIKSVLA